MPTTRQTQLVAEPYNSLHTTHTSHPQLIVPPPPSDLLIHNSLHHPQIIGLVDDCKEPTIVLVQQKQGEDPIGLLNFCLFDSPYVILPLHQDFMDVYLA